MRFARFLLTLWLTLAMGALAQARAQDTGQYPSQPQDQSQGQYPAQAQSQSQAQAPRSAYSLVGLKAGDGPDAEFGGGYAIAKGQDCLIITARHVVIDQYGHERGNIVVTDHLGVTGHDNTILRAFPDENVATKPDQDIDDLAVIKANVPKGFDCGSQWQDGAQLQAVLDQALTSDVKFYIVTMSDNTLKSSPGTFQQATKNSTFTLQGSEIREIRKGNSGSPVIVNQTMLAGILLKTNLDDAKTGKKSAKTAALAPVATVLRQDYINGLIKDLVRREGTVIMLTPILAGGQPVELADGAARSFFETQPRIIIRTAGPDDFNGAGRLINTEDADFVLLGSFQTLAMTPKKSLSDKAQLLGRVLSGIRGLSELGNALNSAGQAGAAVGDQVGTFEVDLVAEYVLVNVKTNTTYTETSTYKGTDKGAPQIVLATALGKSVDDALPKLMVKAGLAVEPLPATPTAPPPDATPKTGN